MPELHPTMSDPFDDLLCPWAGPPEGERRECKHSSVRPGARARLKDCAGCAYRQRWVEDGMPDVNPRATRNAPKPSRTSLPLCTHLGDKTGETVDCPSCRGKVRSFVYKCEVYGRCVLAGKPEGVQACNAGRPGACNDYTPRKAPSLPQAALGSPKAALPPTPGPERGYGAARPLKTGAAYKAGVVLGCYGWPGLVELQLKTIRDTAGDVPVLVCDDVSPRRAEVFHIARHFGADYTDTGCLYPGHVADRLGHTGGDLAVYWQAVHWAARKGLDVVAKLSQRFVITKKGWLRDGAKELMQSTAGLACQPCRGAIHHFDLRTEAALLAVGPWAGSPSALRELLPRRRHPPDVAETLLHRTYLDHVCKFYWPWSLLSEYREKPVDGVLWHYANTLEDYRAAFFLYGANMDPDFSVDGWDKITGTYVY